MQIVSGSLISSSIQTNNTDTMKMEKKTERWKRVKLSLRWEEESLDWQADMRFVWFKKKKASFCFWEILKALGFEEGTWISADAIPNHGVTREEQLKGAERIVTQGKALGKHIHGCFTHTIHRNLCHLHTTKNCTLNTASSETHVLHDTISQKTSTVSLISKRGQVNFVSFSEILRTNFLNSGPSYAALTP